MLSSVSYVCLGVCAGMWVIAFDEVERKPNFDLWRSRVSCPV